MAKSKSKKGSKRHDDETPESEASKDVSGNGAADGKLVQPMSRNDVEAALEPLQVELVKMQEWVKHTGAKVCVLFEGRDAAGKGGIIKRLTERTSPRVFRVVALPSPTEREKTQMYF